MGMLANTTPITVNTRNGVILHPGAHKGGDAARHIYHHASRVKLLTRNKGAHDESANNTNWIKYNSPVEISESFRVVLIDRDQDETQAMAGTLTQNLNFSIEFVVANNAEAALQLIAPETVDLIVFADNSVEMHGLEFLAQLNQKCGKAKIPLIEILNPGEINAGIEALKMGAHDYLLRDYEGHHLALLPILVSRIYTEHQRMVELHNTVGTHQTLDEIIPSVVYKLSLQGGRHDVKVSPELSKLGLTADKWGSDSELHHQLCHSDDRTAVKEALINSYITGAKFECEYRVTTGNDTLRWFQDKAKIVMDQYNRPLFLQGMMTDITQTKNMEAELVMYRNMLEKMVNQRTERLDRRVSILEQCNSSLSENYNKLHQRYIDLLSQDQTFKNAFGAVA